MNKISDKVIKFMEKTMKNRRVENFNWGENLERCIPGRCTITITIRNSHDATHHIFRQCTGGNKLTKSQEKINHLIYMDDIKLFAKNEIEFETLILAVRAYSQNIGMEFGIKRHHTNSEKQKTINDRKNRTTK